MTLTVATAAEAAQQVNLAAWRAIDAFNATHPRASFRMEGTASASIEVEDGRPYRWGLPIVGEHALTRMAEELDRDRALVTVWFRLEGRVNGKDIAARGYSGRGGAVTMHHQDGTTDKARALSYELGQAIRDEILAIPGLETVLWDAHLDGLIKRAQDRIDYLQFLQEAARRAR